MLIRLFQLLANQEDGTQDAQKAQEGKNGPFLVLLVSLFAPLVFRSRFLLGKAE